MQYCRCLGVSSTNIKYNQLSGHKSGAFAIDFGKDSTAILHLSPFALDVYQGGVLLASVNKKGYFNFEHYRTRPTENPPAASNDGSQQPAVENSVNVADNLTDQRLVQGMWSDSFDGKFPDAIPHGLL